MYVYLHTMFFITLKFHEILSRSFRGIAHAICLIVYLIPRKKGWITISREFVHLYTVHFTVPLKYTKFYEIMFRSNIFNVIYPFHSKSIANWFQHTLIPSFPKIILFVYGNHFNWKIFFISKWILVFYLNWVREEGKVRVYVCYNKHPFGIRKKELRCLRLLMFL